MPKFSQRSLDVLTTTHSSLQWLLTEVVRDFDCTILPDGGKRTPERQAELYRSGSSKTLASKHLTGEAIDTAPYPVLWPDEDGISPQEKVERLKRFYAFGGYVKGVASQLGIPIRWGGDWDSDWTFTDQSFHDLPNFELR